MGMVIVTDNDVIGAPEVSMAPVAYYLCMFIGWCLDKGGMLSWSREPHWYTFQWWPRVESAATILAERAARARTQAEAAAFRKAIGVMVPTIIRCFLQDDLGDVDREAGEKTLARVEAAMSGDAGRAIAERVPLWRELEGESREWNLASMCICHLSQDPKFRCLACRIHTTLCKLAALDDKSDDEHAELERKAGRQTSEALKKD